MLEAFLFLVASQQVVGCQVLAGKGYKRVLDVVPTRLKRCLDVCMACRADVYMLKAR